MADAINITPLELEKSLFPSRSTDKDDQAKDVYKIVTDLPGILMRVFGVSFKTKSEVELLLSCPACSNTNSITLWLQAVDCPRFVCKTCKIHKEYGTSWLSLIQLMSNLNRTTIVKKILRHEESKRKRQSKQPSLVPKNKAIFTLK